LYSNKREYVSMNLAMRGIGADLIYLICVWFGDMMIFFKDIIFLKYKLHL